MFWEAPGEFTLLQPPFVLSPCCVPPPETCYTVCCAPCDNAFDAHHSQLSILTRWQTLLQLLSLLRVLYDEGVEVGLAPDLELGLGRAVGLDGLLDPGGCEMTEWRWLKSD